MLAATRFFRGECIKFYESGVFYINAPNNIEQSGVIGAARLFTASAQQPERTFVREDCEHCRGTRSQVR